MGPKINRSVEDFGAGISADGLELYFSSNRLGGYGYSDIYVATRATTNDPWGDPVNLGPVVNSAYPDQFSFLSLDGLLLLFSDGMNPPFRPDGYGGGDIWISRRATLSDPWQAPVNLGPMINGPGSDRGPLISPDGSTLYFITYLGGVWENWQAPILAAPVCGDANHPYPAVDLNKDCRVDLADLAVLLAHWLECTAPECD
jgi:hypothetical protein